MRKIVTAFLVCICLFCSVKLSNFGHCRKAHEFLDSEYIKKHHYEWGKMYPVLLFSGKLGKTKGELKTHWMCRYHAAEWLGHDPAGELQFVQGELK